jgi:hypothetical protein
VLFNNSQIQNPIRDANVSAYNDKAGQKKWMNKSNSVSTQPTFLPATDKQDYGKVKNSLEVTTLSNRKLS